MKLNSISTNNLSFSAQWSKDLAQEVEEQYQNTLKSGNIKEIEEFRRALSTIDRRMKSAKIEKCQQPYSDYFVSTIKPPKDWTMLGKTYTLEHPIKVTGAINLDTIKEIASDLLETDEYIKSEREKNPRCMIERTNNLGKLRHIYEDAQPQLRYLIYNNTDENTYNKLYKYVVAQKPTEFSQDELFTAIRSLIEINNKAENTLEYNTARAYHQKDFGFPCKHRINVASHVQSRVMRALNQLLKEANEDTKMKIYQKPNLHVYSEE